MAKQWCDLVLEGGGVKGLGLVGAFEELHSAGYQVRRVAGTSAGAIVGSLIAAGMPVDTLLALVRGIDYTKFRDEDWLDQLGPPGKVASLVLAKGVYQGDYFRSLLQSELDKLGVRTFADLRLDEPWAQNLPPEQRYKLVVIVSDITRGRLVRLPWDYQTHYGLDPDTQLVADAVRASMSIPFFYEPAKLKGNFLVDGGLLSNFPIDLFDSTSDWPTFGLKLTAKEDALANTNPVHNTLDFAGAILSTMISAHDQMHIDDPCTVARTIFIDTFKIQSTNFDITPAQQQQLYASGKKYAAAFLKDWNFEQWLKKCSH